MCRNEPLVSCKLYVELENFRVSENFNQSFVPSVLLGYKIAETYTLSMSERD